MKTIPAMVLLLCAFCYTVSLNAQRYNHYAPNSIDFVFGIEYGERLLQSSNGTDEETAIIRTRNNAERGKGNFRLGFNYNYLLKEKFYLKTGLRYVHTGYKAKTPANYTQKEQIEFSESGLKQYSYSGYRQIYQMLEIPLGLRYVYSENWCKSYVEAGLSANHYLQTKIRGKNSNDETNEVAITQQNVKPWNVSANIAIGAEFLIQKTIPAFIQMTARYQVTSLTDNAIQERLVAMGIETGVRYDF